MISKLRECRLYWKESLEVVSNSSHLGNEYKVSIEGIIKRYNKKIEDSLQKSHQNSDI